MFPFVSFPEPASMELALPSLSVINSPTETGVATNYVYRIFLGASPRTLVRDKGVWIHIQKRSTHNFVHVQNEQNCTVADLMDCVIKTEIAFGVGKVLSYKNLYVTMAGGLRSLSDTYFLLLHFAL